MKAGNVLWLKFLVLISFPNFAGFFHHPKLIPRNTITLRIRPVTNINLEKQNKIGSTPNSENKMKNWGSIRPPSPTTPPSIRKFITLIYPSTTSPHTRHIWSVFITLVTSHLPYGTNNF